MHICNLYTNTHTYIHITHTHIQTHTNLYTHTHKHTHIHTQFSLFDDLYNLTNSTKLQYYLNELQNWLKNNSLL